MKVAGGATAPASAHARRARNQVASLKTGTSFATEGVDRRGDSSWCGFPRWLGRARAIVAHRAFLAGRRACRGASILARAPECISAMWQRSVCSLRRADACDGGGRRMCHIVRAAVNAARSRIAHTYCECSGASRCRRNSRPNDFRRHHARDPSLGAERELGQADPGCPGERRRVREPLRRPAGLRPAQPRVPEDQSERHHPEHGARWRAHRGVDRDDGIHRRGVRGSAVAPE